MVDFNEGAMSQKIQEILHRGVAIPASVLALNSQRKFDERRQRALFRYYSAAGAGGIAIAVHATQFAIRDPKIGLFEPLLRLGQEEINRLDAGRSEPIVRISGICGLTPQAVKEATLARELGYHAGLLSLNALRTADDKTLVEHAKAVSQVLPIVGFYLQPAVGGRILPYTFWRMLCESVKNIWAIKIAPFNRYQTQDVIRAVLETGRLDIALYTGNDDNIVADLTTPFPFMAKDRMVERRIVGGLLGHWSVWTRRGVELLDECHAAVAKKTISWDLLTKATAVTDCNAAFFDAANNYVGCVAGLHEVLRRQRLLEGIWCLNPDEGLSPGQREEIDRIYAAYPQLNDDEFVEKGIGSWMK
jgi:hypothetical protein